MPSVHIIVQDVQMLVLLLICSVHITVQEVHPLTCFGCTVLLKVQRPTGLNQQETDNP